jgi:hypothetical protein
MVASADCRIGDVVTAGLLSPKWKVKLTKRVKELSVFLLTPRICFFWYGDFVK